MLSPICSSIPSIVSFSFIHNNHCRFFISKFYTYILAKDSVCIRVSSSFLILAKCFVNQIHIKLVYFFFANYLSFFAFTKDAIHRYYRIINCCEVNDSPWKISLCMLCPVGWGCRINRLLLCRGVRPPPLHTPPTSAWSNISTVCSTFQFLIILLYMYSRLFVPLVPLRILGYEFTVFKRVIIIMIIIIIIIIVIIIILLLWEFFTADAFLLQLEWQQVSSSLQDFSQFSGRS